MRRSTPRWSDWKNCIPEMQKAARRRRIRIPAEPYRKKRQRISLNAVSLDSGAAVDDAHRIGEAIFDHRTLVCAVREVDPDEAD